MNGQQKTGVMSRVEAAFRAWQDAWTAYEEAIGARFGLSSSDRRCLVMLVERSATASEVARRLRLTPAAVTALVDRLERRGFVRRTRDPDDRRKLTLEATEKARELASAVREPLSRAEQDLLEDFSLTELWSVIRFLDASTQLRVMFAVALKGEPAPGAKTP
jgi:DNA-binding MarR family transcriptional regulator